jgi:hypothetical protein
MKKTQSASQRKPRRLSLSRETIRALDPVLVGLAQGGLTTGSTDSGCCETNDSEMNQNCYPTNCSLGGTGTKPNYTIPQ